MVQAGPHVGVSPQHMVLRNKVQELWEVPGQVTYKQMYLCSWEARQEAIVLLSSMWQN